MFTNYYMYMYMYVVNVYQVRCYINMQCTLEYVYARVHVCTCKVHLFDKENEWMKHQGLMMESPQCPNSLGYIIDYECYTIHTFTT